MSGLIVEGGVYFLLLFTPFAFGGVEDWALGVIQIVSGLVAGAWAWSRFVSREPAPARAPAWRLLLGALGLFVLLVLAQLAPLPPGWIAWLSPGAHAAYARGLPGYEQGRPFDSASLPAWLLEEARGRIPPLKDPAAGARGLAPGIEGTGFPSRVGAWRTLSVYPPLTRRSLVLFLCLTALFVACVDRFRSRESFARLLTMVVFSAVAVSLFGILQRITWNGKLYWIREGDYQSVFGPFVNRNNFAAFAGTALPIALSMALGTLRRVESSERDALPRLLLWSFASVTTAAGIALSLSRGGILCAGFSVAVVMGFLLYYGARRSDLLALAALILAGAVFLIWLGPERIIERVGTLSQGTSIPSLSSRVDIWKRAGGLVADYPLFGSGLGTFQVAITRYAPGGESWWSAAHNEYVEFLCDTGVLGALLLTVALGACLGLAMRPGRLSQRSGRFPFMGIVAGLGALLAHSIAASHLQIPAMAVQLCVLLAALVALAQRHDPLRRDFRRPRR